VGKEERSESINSRTKHRKIMGPELTQEEMILYRLGEVKATMEKNIANTLFQIHFHKHATIEELVKYYGWENVEEPFTEKEREDLINDTRKRLESEKLVLAFFNREVNNIKDDNVPYKLPSTGDTEKRTTGEGTE